MGRGELRGYILIQVLASTSLFFLAWLLYPPENHFSILTHTFSFLGSFEARHNPRGFVFFSVGLISLSLTLIPLILYRHRRLALVAKTVAVVASALLFVGCVGLMLVALFPDARQDFLKDLSYGRIHNKAALLAFAGLFGGLSMDGLIYAIDRLPRWPGGKGGRKLIYRRIVAPTFLILATVVGAAFVFLSLWEVRYPVLRARDPSITHWPGIGLYSFPLWEWLVMIGLLSAIYTLLLSLPNALPARGGPEARQREIT
jgi:hypothetical membrane protein